MSLVTQISDFAERVATQFNAVFVGPTYTGDLNAAPFGYVSFVDTDVTNDPAFGPGLLLTMKNEDDSARVQVAYSIDGTYAIRYRLGGTWGSWLYFYAGHEAWADITGKPSTFTPATHSHAISDVTSLQAALDAKAPLASPTLTGTPAAPTAAAATNTTQIATTAHVFAERSNSATLTNKTLTSPVINTPTGIVKGDVGLGNVDNTSNATERAATATLTNKTLTSPVINTPTGIVKGDVGLGNVDNTSNATERAATAVLTNKAITPRVNTTASSATPAINTDTTDLFTITALAAAITSMTTNLTGTPVDGQRLTIRITDNGTSRAITWGASFQSSGVATLLANTVISKVHTISMMYDSVKAKWVCLACDLVGY